MKLWQSIGFGVVETSGDAKYGNGAEDSLVVLPVLPAPPLMLNEAASKLWLKGVDSPVSEENMNADESQMISEFVDVGIACQGQAEYALRVSKPVMTSIEHELVYALIARMCVQHSIEYVFVKGPIQYEYGLRDRKHSADVDVWIDPNRIQEFLTVMEPWGWSADSERWLHSQFNHSVTLNASTWGCQIDVHRYFPGSTMPPTDAFVAVIGWRDTVHYAGAEALVLSKPAAAVFFALHGLRPESRHRKKTMARSDAAVALELGGPETVRFSKEFACTDVLFDALVEAFPDESIDRTNRLPEDWKWRSESNWVRAYFMILKSLKPREWFGFLKDVVRAPAPAGSSGVSGVSGFKRIIYRVSPQWTKAKTALNRYLNRKL